MRHLSEKRKQVKKYFFSNEEYGKILDSIVIACVDIILICEEEVLMLKRNVYPRKDWWVIGGRMFPGEDPKDTAKRKLKEEVDLDVKKDRFEFLNVYSTAFSKRQQQPQENGSHTLNLLFVLKISEKEKDMIDLSKKEYEDCKWVNFKSLMNNIRSDDIFLTAIYNDLIEKALI